MQYLRHLVIAASLAVGAAAWGAPAFTNSTPITINDNANASLYPSVINVPSSTPITNVAVQLNGLTHARLNDLLILLVSPTGRRIELVAGATGSASSVDLLLSEEGLSLANNEPVTPEQHYRITVVPNTVQLPSPAPALPYLTSLAPLIGENSQGNWSLFIRDRATGISGEVAAGWTISFAGEGGTFLIPDFDYQGVLRDASGPLNGLFDLRMRFFSSPIASGAPLAETIVKGVPVQNGIFTARFAPSTGLFTEGIQRWVQVGVHGPDDEGFIDIGPRELLATAPYANFATFSRNAIFADLAGSAQVVKWGTIIEVPNNVLNAFSPFASLGGGAIGNTNSGNVVLAQSAGPNVLIGTSTGTSKLTVNGTIESTSGGIKFPDDTVQTTAATTSVIFSASVAADFGSVAADGEVVGTITASGTSFQLSDVVVISPQADLPSGLGIQFARVLNSTQLRFRLRNFTSAAINPPSIVHNFKVIR